MNNQLAELQAKLDHAQNESHKAESEWNHLQTTAAGKTLLIGETRMYLYNILKINIIQWVIQNYFKRAIRNLFQLVLIHHNKEEEINIDIDTDEQLKRVLILFFNLHRLI